jgi:hypothetical protein
MLNEKTNYEELKKWDIKKDKKYLAGNFWEHIFAEIITEEMKAEIKSELKYSWGVTGNIYIEIRQHRQGKWEPSGLSVTTAEYWVHVLKGEQQEQMHATLMFKTETLKKRLRYLYDNGLATITGKQKTYDGTATQAIIVDPRLLLFTDDEILQFKQKVEQDQLNRVKEIFKKNKK